MAITADNVMPCRVKIPDVMLRQVVYQAISIANGDEMYFF